MGAPVGVYSWQIEPFWLEFVQLKMPIKNLPDALQGKVLMQISDIHVGNVVDTEYLLASFKKAQGFQPDIVVYTGDFISYEDDTQIEQLQEVLKHAVKGRLGTVGILGNHDWGIGFNDPVVARKVTKTVEAAGIKILANDKVNINGLQVIGFDDLWSLNFFPEKVMDSYDASQAALVLCHNPDACDYEVWNGYKGWILSGHTHGGQCSVPLVGPPVLPVENKNYTSGLIDLKDGRNLYINRALGYTMPVRFNARPEITVFTLEKE
ncbi:metallophosphoesterase [Neptunitalea sp. Y10]|uniref:Metallophosphoesterase n=1 Tax=Neptunitalea lumnitzerae TaxID=2965509 RepID=A0ABQ5MKU5_9FLAO|nr:metallophosphoesterase [Neptunitalea sp. Y10]